MAILGVKREAGRLYYVRPPKGRRKVGRVESVKVAKKKNGKFGKVGKARVEESLSGMKFSAKRLYFVKGKGKKIAVRSVKRRGA